MKIILGVLANDDDGYDKMVQATKETCYKTIPSNFEVFYLYGHRRGVNDIPQNGYKIDGSNFYYDCPEARVLLLVKTVAFFQYCYYYKDFDYIFRPNCGSYINLPLLEKFIIENNLPKENLYFGVKNKTSKDPFASGAGYLLSKDVVGHIVEKSSELVYDARYYDEELNLPYMDDVSLGKFLNETMGIHIYDKDNVTALRKDVKIDDLENNPNIVDDECYHYYFCHSIDPRCLYKVHQLTENNK